MICQNCPHDLMSSEPLSNSFLLSKTVSKIAEIGANIVWMQDFNSAIKLVTSIESITITCTNDIEIAYNRSNNIGIDISLAKNIYCKLFNDWYNVYTNSKDTESYSYLQSKIHEISSCDAIQRLRVIVIQIKKYLESMTVCYGFCDTVTPGKEVSYCKIALYDINKIVKFTSIGLVDVLNTMFYTMKDIAIFNLSIDTNSTYVTCCGDVVLTKNYIGPRSTITDMKNIYIYYLSAWCSTNIIKENEVMKIRASISKVKNKKYMYELYDLSCELLEVLGC